MIRCLESSPWKPKDGQFLGYPNAGKTRRAIAEGQNCSLLFSQPQMCRKSGQPVAPQQIDMLRTENFWMDHDHDRTVPGAIGIMPSRSNHGMPRRLLPPQLARP